jgi:hypothetical protein
MTLKSIKLQRFNHSNEGDAVPKVVCWTFMSFSKKNTPFEWCPDGETSMSLILVMNCVLLIAFLDDILIVKIWTVGIA